jgi:hypothetical protein
MGIERCAKDVPSVARTQLASASNRALLAPFLFAATMHVRLEFNACDATSVIDCAAAGAVAPHKANKK